MKPNNWNNCESAAAIGRSPKILIDNGHGIETPGKRSHDAQLLVPGQTDVPLPEHFPRVNAFCPSLLGVSTKLFSPIPRSIDSNSR